MPPSVKLVEIHTAVFEDGPEPKPVLNMIDTGVGPVPVWPDSHPWVTRSPQTGMPVSYIYRHVGNGHYRIFHQVSI